MGLEFVQATLAQFIITVKFQSISPQFWLKVKVVFNDFWLKGKHVFSYSWRKLHRDNLSPDRNAY